VYQLWNIFGIQRDKSRERFLFFHNFLSKNEIDLQIRIYIAHDCILFNNKVKEKFRKVL
jgi:hypothetical protein